MFSNRVVGREVEARCLRKEDEVPRTKPGSRVRSRAFWIEVKVMSSRYRDSRPDGGLRKANVGSARVIEHQHISPELSTGFISSTKSATRIRPSLLWFQQAPQVSASAFPRTGRGETSALQVIAFAFGMRLRWRFLWRECQGPAPSEGTDSLAGRRQWTRHVDIVMSR